MDETELKKNVLDLKYKTELQRSNAFLLMATTGLIGFLASFIWLDDKMVIGSVLTFVILSFSYVMYKDSCNRLKDILQEITEIRRVHQ